MLVNMKDQFEATIETKIQLAPTVLLVRMAPLLKEGISFIPGQHVILNIPVGPATTQRPFSIASPPSQQDTIELLIKLIPGGVASTFFENAKIGDTVSMHGPRGAFHLLPSQAPMRCIASSTGIAPFRSMIHDLLEVQGHINPVTLVSIAPIEDELLMDEEFSNLALQYNNFSYQRVTDLADYFTRMTVTHGEDIYLCGGPNFLQDIKTLLLQKDVPPDRIRYEEFK